MYERNFEAPSFMHFCRKKTISIPYSEYVSVALYIQHAERISSNVFSSVASPAVTYFSHYHTKGTILGKKFLNIKCVLSFFSNFCVKHFPFQEELSEMWS